MTARQSGEPHQPRRCRHEDDLPQRCGGIGERPLRRGDEVAYDRFHNLTEASDSRGTPAVRLRPAGQVRERHQPQRCGAEKGIPTPCRVARARTGRQRHTPVLRRTLRNTVTPARGVRLPGTWKLDKAPRPPGV